MKRNSSRFIVGMVCLLGIGFFGSCVGDPPPEVIPAKDDPNGDVIDISSELPPARFAEDNPPTPEGIDLGRHLFYEPMMSGDNTQSCGTCHLQSLGFTDNGKAVSEGITGAIGTRNSMPLFNLMWHDAFFWDSRAVTMRSQVLMPITNPIEMNADLNDVVQKLNASVFYKEKFEAAFGTSDIDTNLVAKALEQFLFSLISDNSKFDRFNRGEVSLTESELRGFEKLKQKGCFNCHSGSLFSDDLSHNTGLDRNPEDKGLAEITKSSLDIGKFKTPSLRNIMVTAPYMHDGRFETIEDVLNFYDHDIDFASPNVDRELLEIGTRAELSEFEIQDIKAFLRTLTDSKFLTDESKSDPFD